MFEIGQIVDKENYTQAAIACNKAGDMHIELQDGQYVIVSNAAPAGAGGRLGRKRLCARPGAGNRSACGPVKRGTP